MKLLLLFLLQCSFVIASAHEFLDWRQMTDKIQGFNRALVRMHNTAAYTQELRDAMNDLHVTGEQAAAEIQIQGGWLRPKYATYELIEAEFNPLYQIRFVPIEAVGKYVLKLGLAFENLNTTLSIRVTERTYYLNALCRLKLKFWQGCHTEETIIQVPIVIHDANMSFKIEAKVMKRQNQGLWKDMGHHFRMFFYMLNQLKTMTPSPEIMEHLYSVRLIDAVEFKLGTISADHSTTDLPEFQQQIIQNVQEDCTEVKGPFLSGLTFMMDRTAERACEDAFARYKPETAIDNLESST